MMTRTMTGQDGETSRRDRTALFACDTLASVSQPVRYDEIGVGYALTRREDPRIAATIHDALGDAASIVNVGAGTGSYEPRDRYVVAIEPSDVMSAQRPRGLAPALRVSAGNLPLRDASVSP